MKETPEGAMIMGNVFDEYAELKVQEKEKTTAVNLLKKGIAIETIAEVLPSLSLEFIKQLKQQLPQS